MVRYVLASAAVLGLLLAGGMAPVAAQTSPTPKAEQQQKKPAAKKMQKTDKQQAMAKKKEGHRLDQVADKLNACQQRPQNERQRCMDDATK